MPEKLYDVMALGEALVEFNQVEQGQPRYQQGYGGDTSNAAIAVARQGGRAAYLTRIGNDAFGKMLCALWEEEGVDTRGVVADGSAPTGLYFVSHGKHGHEFSYMRAGSAASRMTPANLDLRLVAESRWLHFSAISQAISADACDTVFAALDVARHAGTLVSYDPNLRLALWPLARAKAVITATVAQTDLFLPSLNEAELLAGTDDIGAIFAWCFAQGARAVVLKCGSDGAWYAERGAPPQRVAALPAASVDATGAGDCFDGSLLARLAAGDALHEAVAYANVAAALSTQGYGAVAPIPRAPQVQQAQQKR
jgi:2-dehydro-3-deoxygluconokinase